MVVPSKVQSYMANARPVIAAIDGEAARIVRESGWRMACPPEDPLAGAVLCIARMASADGVEMGLRNRPSFEANFERDLLIGEFARVLHETVDRGPVP